MIVYQRDENIPKYGQYFLFEAPGDEEPPRRNMKNISVLPDNRKRTDFTAGAEEIDEPADNPDPEPGAVDEPVDEDLGQNQDFTQTDDQTGEDLGQDQDFTQTDEAPPEEGEVQPDNPPVDNPEGNPEGENVTPDTPPEEGGGDDMGETEDFTDGGEEAPADELNAGNQAGSDPNANPEGEQQKLGPGVDFEATRKYNLFKEFLNIMEAIDTYNERLENYYIDDPIRNKIIRLSIEKLSEIKEQIYEFIMMRFELSSYIQCLMFYQKMRVSILLVFNLLEKIKFINKMKEKLNNNDKRVTNY